MPNFIYNVGHNSLLTKDLLQSFYKSMEFVDIIFALQGFITAKWAPRHFNSLAPRLFV